MKIEPNTTISHYKILSKIGKGGMGEVYLAQDTKLERKVAIKVLSDEFNNDPERLKRFVQEARAASALNHPNILTIYEIGKTGETNFIATEFIEGTPLSENLSWSSLNLTFVLDTAMQIASALETAHRAGIVHRDIKPDNVMLRPDGVVKIVDFGIAKLVEERRGDTQTRRVGEEDKTLIAASPDPSFPSSPETLPGMIIGTAHYMSPEQGRGKSVDARSDIFSFGVLLYEMLAGEKAFDGESAMDVIGAILFKEPLPLSQILPDLPKGIEQIVSKMMRKSRADRFQNAKEVYAAFEQFKQRGDYDEFSDLAPTRISRERPAERETKLFDSSASGESSLHFSAEKLPPGNLSAELSPLFGREKELAEITGLLKSPNIRLLTITGVGGTGKTRLAGAVAHHLITEFTDGIFFIDLSAIRNPELVIPIIAQTLGVKSESGKSVEESLGNFLEQKNLFLIVDNFEQIIEAAPVITELLSRSVNLKILVTSRVRLNLTSEHEFTLEPLSVPADSNLPPDQLGKYPAVALFTERAKAVKPDFRLSSENAESVAEICRRLDGLPLALELAAVRVKLLAPRAILTRLTNALKLLTGGARDLPERQKTIRATISWSYELLEAEEKKLLNRLAVFAGGFSLDGAEAVGDPGQNLEIDLLDGVGSLVDKSLLSQREQADGEPRFKILQVVRDFALENLEATGEFDKISRVHGGFYAAVSEKAEAEIMGANAAFWLDKLEQEHDNLRVALEWTSRNEPETALRIVGAILNFWTRRGHLDEGSKWAQRALENNLDDTDRRLRAKAFRGVGNLNRLRGELEKGYGLLEESLRLSREIGDKSMIASALRGLGSVKIEQGDFSSARILSEESLSVAREIDDKSHISLTLNTLGDLAREERDYQAAKDYYQEALEIARHESLDTFIPSCAANLASASCLLGDYESAHMFCLESLDVGEEIGDKLSIGNVLDRFAALMVNRREMEKAATLWGAAQSIYKNVGSKLEKVDQDFNDRYMSNAGAVMGNEAFEAAYAEGRKMPVKNAIRLARQTEKV